MRYISETLSTPVRYDCDVFVAGGGIAGVSAALAAAREGARVILAERGFFPGGLATAGLIAIYLPIADGKGRQASFGIAEELLRLAVEHGAVDRFPQAWHREGMTPEDCAKNRRISVQYNPNVFAILLEELLLKEQVRILYGTTVCGVVTARDRITEAVVENKSGRSAVAAGAFVDATGDADLWTFAGAKTQAAPEGNALAAWYYFHDTKGVQLKILGAADGPEEETGLVPQRFRGTDGEELSRFMQLSHKAVMQDVAARRRDDASTELVCMGSIPQLRMTRRIVGCYTLEDRDGGNGFPDSIGMVASWRSRGVIYQIPYRTLYGPEFANLITAGRSLSATGLLWDCCRVIPACAVTGQAAGTAAAMGGDFRTLDVGELQRRLKLRGVKPWL